MQFTKISPWSPGKPRLLGTLLLALSILTWFAAAGAATEDAAVPLAQDLAADGRILQDRHIPMLVMFSAPGCAYCRKLLDEFLLPMQRNPEYREKVLMRRIEIDSSSPLHDFSGKTITQRQFAVAHKVRLVPTVALLGPNGEGLAEPLVGLSSPDYYGAFLDQAIDESLAKLRAPR
ncbi:MAG: thioredoxin family protein [Sulfuricellaceae bacterium]|nr:thioredoxin family protein [Sulfuricellaceae bacterium]